MDITDTLAPKSDQLDNVDLIAGPRVFTVERVDVRPGAEQPVNVHFAEFPRPWRPGKTMRRILAACWSPESSTWIGKRVELFRDPDVKFGNDTPGGTRIRAVSHIDTARTLNLPTSKGKVGRFVIEPLPTEPNTQTLTDTEVDAQIENIAEACTTAEIDDIARRIGKHLPAHRVDEVKAAAKARRAALDAPADPTLNPTQGTLDDTVEIERDGEPS